jgi:hypothetical protein
LIWLVKESEEKEMRPKSNRAIGGQAGRILVTVDLKYHAMGILAVGGE